MTSKRLSLTALLIIGTCLQIGCGVDAREANPSQARYLAIARGEVDVEGGMVPIFASQSGRLLKVNAHLGQRVKPGDILATLDSRSLRAAQSIAQGDVTMARARQHAAHLKRQSAAVWFAKLNAAQAADATSLQTVDEARLALADQIALERIATAEANAAAGRQAAAAQAIAELAIRAPVSGELVRVRAAPFMRVTADNESPIFVLLPDRPRVVHAQVDEEFANVLHDGVRAAIVLGDTAETIIPAKAVRFSSWLRRADSVANSDERTDAKVIDCEIALDAPTLRVGQRVLVRFLNDKS